MLVSLKLTADFSRRCPRLATQPPLSATHPHPAPRKNRSPGCETPARSGSQAALPWTVLQLRVEVNHHTRTARAPLACHPRTTRNVVHASLKTSQAGALLVRTLSFGGHVTPRARRHRGRSGRQGCGCLPAYRSYVPTPGSLSVPQRSKSPCDHWHRRRS
jgi:hypothetical protein